MEYPDWLSAEKVTMALTLWGAGLSTLLGVREVRKRRLNLSTTYAFYGTDQIEDEIIIVNLSPVPVFVSHWTLAWEPKLLSRRDQVDATPDDPEGFKIDGEDSQILFFGEANKLPWGHNVSAGRNLVLTLRIHGRRRPKRLTIVKG